ncbi:ABC transporter ATP-binding protein [Brachybacterium alimentarium]|uniref:Peptide ABC transporter ATP-binding protein n=1 Tax=Brachybacterium alimentarium TaxID=47845 RepID=A0A2A3YEA1_9MICO|nr:ABC transporter ATP-binding protein [Brachybacterium alimentarium]PCC37650.1 peptide ABC transporter ATP-binding protein [Brachybacterium alimentarium]RCS74856.1 ABC transporter ATP-binding protein [Brachybacterium alimentarium]
MPPATMLTAASLHAGYPGEEVLTGVDLSISAGDAPLGLLGPSGAGKTTLIQVLSGELRPSSGQVTLDGRSVHKLRGKDRKSFRAAVRFVSQYAMTISDPRETADSRLQLAAKEARKGGRTHAVSPAEMLSGVGLGEHFLTRRMMTLSGGEKQRVALATALATRPEILVLDEPLTAVDPGMRGEISTALRGLIEQLGIGVLIASHDTELLQRMCPQVAFLGGGRILARGTLPEVLAHTEHDEIRDLAESAPQAVQRFF